MVSIRKDTLVVDPHYSIRVLVGVLFINTWHDNDNITFTITSSPNIVFNIRRGNGSDIGNICSGNAN